MEMAALPTTSRTVISTACRWTTSEVRVVLVKAWRSTQEVRRTVSTAWDEVADLEFSGDTCASKHLAAHRLSQLVVAVEA